MLWKKKTDDKILTNLHLGFSYTLQLDSSLSDEELVDNIKKQLKEYFTSDFTLNIGRIERDIEGKICSLRQISF